ncbi:MAG TPA: hypothetical protein VLJ15_00050 [Gammaproteobacteria bacterium]|nr:hypothetical protein [Gammaproteobacteria bacterium]
MQKIHKQPLIILLLFLLPVIVSWFLFHYHTFFHWKTTNHGTLIETPVNIADLSSNKKWHVIYISDKPCTAGCQNMRHQLQQVQKALGNNRDRIALLWMNSDDTDAKKLQILPGASSAINNKIYLADPLGNVFMYYSATIDPVNVLQDLKHVLEVSQIG